VTLPYNTYYEYKSHANIAFISRSMNTFVSYKIVFTAPLSHALTGQCLFILIEQKVRAESHERLHTRKSNKDLKGSSKDQGDE
jgi:hypothetical protein